MNAWSFGTANCGGVAAILSRHKNDDVDTAVIPRGQRSYGNRVTYPGLGLGRVFRVGVSCLLGTITPGNHQ